MGFKLSKDKTGKDQGKANYANAFIGFGVLRHNGISSTGIYLEDAKKQGIPYNDNIKPNKNTIAFVSVSSEGVHNDKTIALCKKVLEAKGNIIMDKRGKGFGQSHSSFNIKGEGAVQDALGKPTGTSKEGYTVWKGRELNLKTVLNHPPKKKDKGMSM